MPTITSQQTRTLLQNSADHGVSRLANETELVVALTAVFNASLEIAENFPRTRGELAMATSKKLLAVSAVATKGTSSTYLEASTFVAGQTLKTMGLVKIAGMTPARAATYITLTMAEKVVSAAGMAQISKCKMAIASLTLTTGAGAFVCVGSLGIGCIAGAIAVAADAFNVHGQCTSP